MRRIDSLRKGFFVSLLLGALSLFPSLAQGYSFNYFVVDDGGDGPGGMRVGEYISLAFDPSGNPAISYYDISNENLKYAFRQGGIWTIWTVDSSGDVGQYSSLAFDANGRPAISYFDFSTGNLKYASFDGTNWNFTWVDTAGSVGWNSSLAFDPNGNPAISYGEWGTSKLKYASWNGSSWNITTVETGNNVDPTNVDRSRTSLAFDPNGNPAIAYYDGLTYEGLNGDLKYAFRQGGSWTIWTVDSTDDVGQFASLAFDANGRPAISYFDDTDRDLKYASFDGTNWNFTWVDTAGDVGYWSSLAFDANGRPAISYYDGTNGDLKYASFDGTNWNLTAVDGYYYDVGTDTSLAFDPNGNPAISYYDSTNGLLKFAIVPEPGSLLLLASGLVGLTWRSRRKKAIN